jgi:DNA-binding transcriptional ArsR family regulator
MSADPQYVAHDSDIAPIAALIADPTRAAILTVLLDGRPLAAGELAYLAGVSAATASAHLTKLLGGGLVSVTRQGRHRYYRLAGPEVAAVIEALAQVSPRPRPRGLRQSRQAAALQDARTCYDHLAGRAGVALLDALLRKEIIKPVLNGCAQYAPVSVRAGAASRRGQAAAGAMVGAGDLPGAEFEVTSSGADTLAAFGINLGELRRSRRRFAGACLDWTQRRPHLNGALGAAITAGLLGHGWFEHGRSRRSLRLTDAGRDGLAETFGCVIGG